MLSQKAFEIFCNEVVRDAGEKNEKLKLENASLTEAPYKLLTSFRLLRGIDLLKEINLLEDDRTEDENDLHYSFETVDIPVAELFRNLQGKISGVICNTGRQRPPALAFVDFENELLALQCFLSDSITAFGFVKQYTGTVQDIESMIRGNRHTLRFEDLGAVDALTGQPIEPMTDEDFLDNALISIHMIKIPKVEVQHIMTLLTRSDQEANESRMNVRDELRVLQKVIPSRKDICLVEEENDTLLSKNSLLGLSRNVLQTLDISGPSDETYVSLTLGKGEAWLPNGDSGPILQFLSEDAAVIPLSSLAALQVKVSGVTLNRPSAPIGSFIADNDGRLYVCYSAVVAMAFSFDESLSADIENSFTPGGLQQYIDYIVATSQPNVTRIYQGPTPDLTMRLRTISLRMVAIEDHFSTLGISIETGEQD